MTLFRLLLVAIITFVGAYTVFVISEHGMNFLPAYLWNIAAMGWPGQFNMDFSAMLVLGSLWLMWRHHFSPLGLIFGLVIFVGGAPFLCSYLLVVMTKESPDIAVLLLGKARVASIKGG